MSSHFHSSLDSASAPSPMLLASAGWAAEADDLALGCECADPALQIESWGQEVFEAAQNGGAAP